MIPSNSPGRELIRTNIKLPDCVLQHKIKKSLGFSTEQFYKNEQLYVRQMKSNVIASLVYERAST